MDAYIRLDYEQTLLFLSQGIQVGGRKKALFNWKTIQRDSIYSDVAIKQNYERLGMNWDNLK